ncbi:MAG: hypothetical protein WKF77_20780 [Planctomycetaceae bacterium]
MPRSSSSYFCVLENWWIIDSPEPVVSLVEQVVDFIEILIRRNWLALKSLRDCLTLPIEETIFLNTLILLVEFANCCQSENSVCDRLLMHPTMYLPLR